MQYGLIGEKLSHSFSKEVHALIGDYEYALKEIAPDNLTEFILGKNFKGLNVTIPYKQSVIPLLDYVDPLALEIGAVNTVVNSNGKLCGYNTDCLGVQCLIDNLSLKMKDKKVIILGTGGTSKTVKSVVKNNGAKSIYRVSRQKGKGDITYDELYNHHTDAHFIINTTPVGMYPNVNALAVELERFKDLQGVIDVVYNPIQTNLVLQAKKLNVPTTGGLYMLVAQAVYAYGYFFNKHVDKKLIDGVYRKILNSKRNIVLVGMPSCGKTTVGNILAQELNRLVFDTDELIVNNCNKPIPEIFATQGESCFREQESLAVESVSLKSGVIISTGGGAVLKESNVLALKRNGKVFFIDRPLENLLATDDRPLSSDEDKLKKMYAQRRPIYLACADVVIDASNSARQVAEQIIKEL